MPAIEKNQCPSIVPASIARGVDVQMPRHRQIGQNWADAVHARVRCQSLKGTMPSVTGVVTSADATSFVPSPPHATDTTRTIRYGGHGQGVGMTAALGELHVTLETQ